MRVAVRCGATVRQAWGLCPCEIGEHRDAQAARDRAADDRLLLAAWATAAWSRLDVLPGPSRCIAWLRDGKPLRDAQSADEIEAVLESHCRGDHAAAREVTRGCE